MNLTAPQTSQDTRISSRPADRRKALSYRLFLIVPFIAALIFVAPTSTAIATDAKSREPWQNWIVEDHEPDGLIGSIWSTRDRTFVSPSKLLEAVGEVQIILLGENHDNAVHHHLQGWIIRNAPLSGIPSVVMEQIDTGKTQALETFLAQPDPDPVKLGEALDWSDSGWPDWELYLPVARAALHRGADILPGLPSKQLTRNIARTGLSTLPRDRLSELQLDRALPANGARALQVEIAEAHCDLLPESAIPAMVDVQRLRDAFMAEAVSKAATSGSAFLITGNGHVTKNRAVPWYLDRAGVEGALVIKFAETLPMNRKMSNAPADGSVADYVWFTSHVDRGDPCAMLIDTMDQSE
ncbi:ChaN family lipoprotein [Hoeflea sp.]|uniref:ChaN family lipoprotein n=1 Tax=Hoeflea sp. TaxID=1940281 RepID=UPI003B520B4A